MDHDFDKCLLKYPKPYQPLPPAYQAIYQKHYKENRTGASAASFVIQKMESWMHRKVAEDVASDGVADNTTLELGAGTLNHLAYEPLIKTYDIVEPFKELFKGSLMLSRVRKVYNSIFDISADSAYSRIISIATLEHLRDLPAIVAQCGKLLAEGGTFRAGIPNEGTWLWRLGYGMTTGLEFRLRYHLDYSVLMRHEHVNTANEIDMVLKRFFGKVDCSVFGVSENTAFYRFYECSQPDRAFCSRFLDGLTSK